MNLKMKENIRVYVYSEAIDMRAGFTTLQALVSERMKGNLYEGNVFLFLGKNRRRAKCLLFDGTGLCLLSKRLDRGGFMPVADLFGTSEISYNELGRILDGANLRVVYAAAMRERAGQGVA